MATKNYWIVASLAAGALALGACGTDEPETVGTGPGMNTAEAPEYGTEPRAEDPMLQDDPMAAPGSMEGIDQPPGTVTPEGEQPQQEGAVVGTAPPGGTQPTP